MTGSLILACLWVIAATVVALLPSRRNHWPAARVLIATGLPILGLVIWQNGVWTGLFVFLFIAVFEWEAQATRRRRLIRLGTALLQAVLVAAIVSVVFEKAFLVRLP